MSLTSASVFSITPAEEFITFGENMAGIYLWINKTNGKVYVGQTKNDFTKRKNQHIRDYKKVLAGRLRTNGLYSAMIAEGVNNFEFVEYFTVFLREDLNYYERAIISETGSFASGYNLTTGGSTGAEVAQSTLELRKKNALDLWKSEEFLNLMRLSRSTKEFKSLRANIAKNLWLDPKYVEKQKNSRAISLKSKGYLDAQSKSKLLMWSDPDKRKCLIDSQNAGRATDEYRKKRSEISKRLVSEGRICKHNCKRIIVNGVEYESMKSARISMGMKTLKGLHRMLREGSAQYKESP